MSAGERRRKRATDQPRVDRAPLSRHLIVTTALQIIDREGLEALSMRHLGAALGVDSMAIYYYLPNKAALFDGVVEAIYRDLTYDDIDPALPWQDQLSEAMRRFRQALRRHPNALPVVATRPPVQPDVLGVIEHLLAVLIAGSGLPPAQALNALTCAAVYTIGHALAEVGQPVGGEGQTPDETLAEIAGRYPHLAEAVASASASNPDAQFELGLRAMVVGLAALTHLGAAERAPNP